MIWGYFAWKHHFRKYPPIHLHRDWTGVCSFIQSLSPMFITKQELPPGYLTILESLYSIYSIYLYLLHDLHVVSMLKRLEVTHLCYQNLRLGTAPCVPRPTLRLRVPLAASDLACFWAWTVGWFPWLKVVENWLRFKHNWSWETWSFSSIDSLNMLHVGFPWIPSSFASHFSKEHRDWNNSEVQIKTKSIRDQGS